MAMVNPAVASVFPLPCSWPLLCHQSAASAAFQSNIFIPGRIGILRPPFGGRLSLGDSTSIASIMTHSSSSPVVVGFHSDRDSSSESASEVVRALYAGINSRDLASVEKLIADNYVYEDLIFPRPFTGRESILNFFQKFINSISKDLQFVIDDISKEDSLIIGVTWHLEWQGKTFPFSKGCSLYRLELSNGRKKIVYGRDSVEPLIKPGESALVAIKGVTWLLQKFPQVSNPL